MSLFVTTEKMPLTAFADGVVRIVGTRVTLIAAFGLTLRSRWQRTGGRRWRGEKARGVNRSNTGIACVVWSV
jgi:hypothetical protein